MEYTKFIKLVDERVDKGLINGEYVMGKNVSWEHLKLVKAGSERINYHCNFKNEKCFYQQKCTNTVSNTKAKMCCCIDCFKAVGHFRHLPQDNEIEMKILARKFIEPKDPEKLTNSGFWRVGKGCILPRMYRSLTCLGYICNMSMLPRLEQFYIHHILTFYSYNKIENRLIEFMAKENNTQTLSVSKASPSQKRFAIDMLWKFVEQEFNEYKKRKKLQFNEYKKRKELEKLERAKRIKKKGRMLCNQNHIT